ncbi:MAG: sensor histidine kinase KdpD [Clostridiales bacterium]|nr:sensor histidine kinase KdpD [Clostridiales bacterium]
MSTERATPEELLRRIHAEEEAKEKEKKGKLCIFLGYAAGVGKTCAMLDAAHELLKEGVDLVSGYIEPHARPETSKREEGLEKVPPLLVPYKGIDLRELDLDAVLRRKPQLVLVDELAHTNAAGMRHRKRYEDIEEILDAGIDVYTTVNIQHLESLNDIVESITGIHVRERVPDKIFDSADQVKLVDIEPDILIERLKEGKIYKAVQAERALQNFFAKDKLIALREIALRRMADKVNRLAILEHIQNESGENGEYYQGEHIMTCISAAPSCKKVIRSASRMAYAFHAKFTALYVETTALQNAEPAVKKARDENIHLAEALGAKVVTVFGDDIAFQIAEYARVSSVTKLVLGRTNHRILLGQKKGTLTDQISEYMPELDIFIIPDMGNTGKKRYFLHTPKRYVSAKATESLYMDLLKETAALCMATGVGFLFRKLGFVDADIIMGYLFSILILSLYTTRRYIAVSAAVLSVFLFDWFFVYPYYSLTFYSGEYSVTFGIMLLFSIIISTVLSTGRRQARESAKIMYRTELLLENSRKMRRVENVKDLLMELSEKVLKLMNLSVVFYVRKDKKTTGPWLFPREGVSKEELGKTQDEKERAVVDWVMANKKRAGCCTHTLPDAKAMYLPVKTSEEIYGVMGIILEEKREIPSFEYGLLTAMLNEAALVFARIYLVQKEK